MRRRSLKSGHPSRSIPSMADGRIPMTSLIQVLAVAEYLNFRHAANALGVSQSSVSARIKMLEEELGVLLFERRSRGVRLTEAGRHFVEQVSIGIDQLDHAVKTAGALARAERGVIRIGVHALISSGFFAELLSGFRELHPGVDIVIVEGSARETLMQVRDARLDIAFVADPCSVADCHSRPLWTEVLVAAIPTSHPLTGCKDVTWCDLAADTFLIRYGDDGALLHDRIRLRLMERGPPPTILRVNVDRLTLMSMVAQGYGVTIASEGTAQIRVPGVLFLPILDEPEPIVFSAIWSPGNRSPALRAFLDLAQKAARSPSAP
jgi:DNA-binding transcriptional LysR family regulator